jgi:hypothetical protein
MRKKLLIVVSVFILGMLNVNASEQYITAGFGEDIGNAMGTVIRMLRFFYDILVILIPMVLIVMGSLDLLKATASQDEKAMSAAKSSLGRRFIWATVALVSMIIFRLFFSLFDGGSAFLSYWN